MIDLITKPWNCDRCGRECAPYEIFHPVKGLDLCKVCDASFKVWLDYENVQVIETKPHVLTEEQYDAFSTLVEAIATSKSQTSLNVRSVTVFTRAFDNAVRMCDTKYVDHNKLRMSAYDLHLIFSKLNFSSPMILIDLLCLMTEEQIKRVYGVGKVSADILCHVRDEALKERGRTE